jgi:hypothetical protein
VMVDESRVLVHNLQVKPSRPDTMRRIQNLLYNYVNIGLQVTVEDEKKDG